MLDQRRVQNLSELANYDVVVNCLGLGAKKLFSDDKMFPVRYSLSVCCDVRHQRIQQAPE